MSATLEVGVVGVGHLGRHHARIYASLPDVRLVGVADVDRERAAAVAGPLGCEVFDDAQALIGRVRAASVAVPTAAHGAVAIPLLEAGVDLLVEKPLAATPAEARAMHRAALDHGRVLMVGHTERFNPALVALARVVEAPRFFEIHRLAPFSARSTDIDVVLDLMIHDLDLVLHLDGSPVEALDAVGVSALTDKVDIANARIRFASGCVANLTASRISAEPLRRIRVFQARTYLACDTGRREVERVRLVEGGDAPAIVRDRLPVEDAEPLALELRAFVSAVRGEAPVEIGALEAARALELAQRIGRAIAAGP